MIDEQLPNGPFFRISLRGADGAYPDLLSVATFLLDFTTLYELLRLAAESKKDFYQLTQSREALYRNARRVSYEQKLFLERLRHESPIEVVGLFTALGAGAGAMWALVQVVEKIYNIPINRQKLVLEVQKLEGEVEKINRENATASVLSSSVQEPVDALGSIQEIDTAHVVDTVIRRLDRSEIKITQADIDLVIDLTEIKGDEPGRMRKR
ncbi:hypothetical protein HMI51_05135 [Corallococcus coralloides]|nr:hypothetical protein [Corallococcus coralloides]